MSSSHSFRYKNKHKTMLKGEFGWGISFLLIVLAILSSLPHQTICQEVASVSTTKISLPDCPDKCGDVAIPYPFGIGDKCHYHHLKDGVFYNITCNHTRVPSFPTYGGVKVVKITLDGEFRVSNYISYMCFDKNGMITQNTTSWISVTRFALSTTQNIAGAIGCDTMAVFSGTMMNSTTEFLSGCITGCFSESDVSSKCEGLGCCQASIPDGVSNITLKAGTIMNHTYVVDFNPCSVAFVVAKDHLQQSHSDEMLFTIQSFLKKDVSLYKDASELLYPAVYDWSIGTKDCKSAKAEGEQLLCKGNTKCVDDLPGQWGYRCECKPGFTGINPYLHDCQDINECADNGLHNCEKQEYCHNNPGSYRCQCPQSFNGNGTKESPCVRIQKKVLLPMESIIILAKAELCSWCLWMMGDDHYA